MILVQLKELSLPWGNESTIPEYLEKLLNLTKLQIEIVAGYYLNRIMKTVCNAPKLEELKIIDCDRLISGFTPQCLVFKLSTSIFSLKKTFVQPWWKFVNF